MGNARNLAKLAVDSNGDVASASLDNVVGLPDAIDVNASAPADSLAIGSTGTVTQNIPSASDYTIYKTNGSTKGVLGDESGNFIIKSAASLLMQTNGSERMRIDSSGRVTMPYQPAFRAYKSTGTTSSGSNFVYDTAPTNIGSHYNTSNGRFTAPVSGMYHFSWTALLQNNQAVTDYYIRVKINGSGVTDLYAYAGDANNYYDYSNSISLYLSASDYVTISSGSGVFAGGFYNTSFSGFLIG